MKEISRKSAFDSVLPVHELFFFNPRVSKLGTFASISQVTRLQSPNTGFEVLCLILRILDIFYEVKVKFFTPFAWCIQEEYRIYTPRCL